MFRRSVLVPLLIAAIATTALAQRQKAGTDKTKSTGRPPALLTRMHPYDVLHDARVRMELKLTPAQEAKVNEAKDRIERFKQDNREIARRAAEEPDPEVQAVLRERLDRARAANDQEVETLLLKSLEPGQRLRLQQIGIQQEGASFFLRPAIQELLNLSPEQVELIREIQAEGGPAIRQARQIPRELAQKAVLPPEPGQDRRILKLDPRHVDQYRAAQDKASADVRKISASMEQRAAKLLTKKQLQNYLKLRGEPFNPDSAGQAVKTNPPS